MQFARWCVLWAGVALLAGCQSGYPGVDREGRLPNLDYLDGGRAMSDGNTALAAKYYLRCAEARHGGCMINVAGMYSRGTYFEKDMVEALKWAEGAAATGDSFGMAAVLGTRFVASFYCQYPELGGSYPLVQQWTDSLQTELSRLQKAGLAGNAEVDAILQASEEKLAELRTAISSKTCKF